MIHPHPAAGWRARLPIAWLTRNGLSLSLWPVSLIYGLLVRARAWAYRLGWIKTSRLSVPVIVIGNVVVGGAGKTPTVIAVVQHLMANGHRPGVISRGYGAQRTQAAEPPSPLEVTPDASARLVGDEPLLIHNRTGVPVFVARDRVSAGNALLHRYPGTTIVVCDDGLQHLALHSDVSVAVFDERGLGNGWLLPAGLLREPWPAHSARSIDLVLHITPVPSHTGVAWPTQPVPAPPLVPVFNAGKQLANEWHSATGQRTTLTEWVLKRHRTVALAGIAKPQAFFDMLAACGVTVLHTIAFEDHDHFDGFLNSTLLNSDMPESLLLTEKDAVKLFPLLRAQAPDLAKRTWAVPLTLQPDPAFWDALDKRLSSDHGHPSH